MSFLTPNNATLRSELADATTLVWKMQNALSESPASEHLLPELMQYAEELKNKALAITGTVARWQLSEKQ